MCVTLQIPVYMMVLMKFRWCFHGRAGLIGHIEERKKSLCWAYRMCASQQSTLCSLRSAEGRTGLKTSTSSKKPQGLRCGTMFLVLSGCGDTGLKKHLEGYYIHTYFFTQCLYFPAFSINDPTESRP